MIRIPRLPWHQFFMLHAHLAATRSTCDRGPELLLDPGRHGVGAVLVRNHRIIAGGYNGSPPGQPHCSDPDTYRECEACGGRDQEYVAGDRVCSCSGSQAYLVEKHGGHLMVDGHCVRTIHAERNALLQCALDGVSPNGASLYVTASPCYDCAKDIIRSGIIEVYYGLAYSSRYGISDQVGGMLDGAGIKICHLLISPDKLGLDDER